MYFSQSIHVRHAGPTCLLLRPPLQGGHLPTVSDNTDLEAVFDSVKHLLVSKVSQHALTSPFDTAVPVWLGASRLETPGAMNVYHIDGSDATFINTALSSGFQYSDSSQYTRLHAQHCVLARTHVQAIASTGYTPNIDMGFCDMAALVVCRMGALPVTPVPPPSPGYAHEDSGGVMREDPTSPFARHHCSSCPEQP